ncbi:MAG: short-chain fatty acyl-CoA regulator family protein [Alphaproteobacteria bacterium]
MRVGSERKLFQGARLRRLRRTRGLTQARMAEELGLSAAYLNLLERNQRPVTARVLMRLAEVFDVDLRSFGEDGEGQLVAGLREVFADPLFSSAPPSLQDLKEFATTSPETANGLLVLYRAYRESAATATELAERVSREEGVGFVDAGRFPAEDVREVLRARTNHFPELEAAAEDFLARADIARDETFSGLKSYVRRTAGIGVIVVPADVMPTTLRRFDHHRNRLLLSEMLPESGRVFQLSFQIALIEYGALLDSVVAQSNLAGEESRRMLRITLANYFAGAVMMPYGRFLSAAENARHDLDILSHRFGASIEQVCHRLATLQRPGARGVPFFLIRVDNAGNVSKRFSATTFQFARLGGACPRWNVHDAFRVPGRVLPQIVEMPDGAAYFGIARTVGRPGLLGQDGEQHHAIALGCEIQHAARIVYADGLDIDNSAKRTPIGINCRLCPREDCGQRAFAPLDRRLVVTEHRRDLSPFRFATD